MVSRKYWCVITDLVLVTKAVISPPIWKQRRDYCSIFKMLSSSEQSPFLYTEWITTHQSTTSTEHRYGGNTTTAQTIFLFVLFSRKTHPLCIFGCERVSSLQCHVHLFALRHPTLALMSQLHTLIYFFYLLYKYANFLSCCQIEIRRLEIPCRSLTDPLKYNTEWKKKLFLLLVDKLSLGGLENAVSSCLFSIIPFPHQIWLSVHNILCFSGCHQWLVLWFMCSFIRWKPNSHHLIIKQGLNIVFCQDGNPGCTDEAEFFQNALF